MFLQQNSSLVICTGDTICLEAISDFGWIIRHKTKNWVKICRHIIVFIWDLRTLYYMHTPNPTTLVGIYYTYINRYWPIRTDTDCSDETFSHGTPDGIQSASRISPETPGHVCSCFDRPTETSAANGAVVKRDEGHKNSHKDPCRPRGIIFSKSVLHRREFQTCDWIRGTNNFSTCDRQTL